MKNIILAVVLLCNMQAYSQEPMAECGTITPRQKIRVNAAIQRNIQATLPFTIKMMVHVFRGDDGNNAAAPLNRVQEKLEELYAYFRPHQICFIVANVMYHNNSNLLNFNTGSFPQALDLRQYIVEGYLNVFIHRSVRESDGNVLGGSAFGIPAAGCSINGGMVIDVNYPTGTLTHEVGHCLGLYHTFESVWGAESVARSGDCKDCEDDGDLLCDTPADPQSDDYDITNFIMNCIYNDNKRDDCNMQYTPDVQNHMSYSPGACRNRFSPGQASRMRNLILQESVLTELMAEETIFTSLNTSSGYTYILSRDWIRVDPATLIDHTARAYFKSKEVTLKAGVHLKPGSSGFSHVQLNRNCQ